MKIDEDGYFLEPQATWYIVRKINTLPGNLVSLLLSWTPWNLRSWGRRKLTRIMAFQLCSVHTKSGSVTLVKQQTLLHSASFQSYCELQAFCIPLFIQKCSTQALISRTSLPAAIQPISLQPDNQESETHKIFTANLKLLLHWQNRKITGVGDEN